MGQLLGAVAFLFLWTFVWHEEAVAAPRREIVINVPAFRLTLYEDGVAIRSYPVGVGRNVKPSVFGDTEIINKVTDPTYYPPDWWKRGLEPIPPGPDNPVGTRWLGLGFPGYGIHGTNQPESIGTAASSGCIRMYNEDVEELARLVGVGTPVRLVYETIEAWVDPVRDVPVIRVYPDIYGRGGNSVESALDRLAQAGVTGPVDMDHLFEVVKSASAVPVELQAPIPLAEEMIEHESTVAFPKRGVGLVDGGVAMVWVVTLVAPDGTPRLTRVRESTGIDYLDRYAELIAQSSIRYMPYSQSYEVGIAVVYDASDPSGRRISLRAVGTIKTGDLMLASNE